MNEFVTYPPFYVNENKFLDEYFIDENTTIYVEDEDWAYAVTVFNNKTQEYTERYHLVTNVEEFIQNYNKNN